MATEAYVKSSTKAGVCTIEFFHPQSNSLPGKVLGALADEISRCGASDDVKVIILRSGGDRTFCAGASFDELMRIEDKETGLVFFSGFANVINAMRTCGKLIIGRVQGKVVGGGVGLACAADICFATKFAGIRLSELAIGIGPFVVGPAVERRVGNATFTLMTLTPDEWRDADWGIAKGMYSQLFESTEEMDIAVEKLATELAQRNPEALLALKEVFWQGTENWDQLLADRAAISGELVLSDFTRNAINKFKTK